MAVARNIARLLEHNFRFKNELNRSNKLLYSLQSYNRTNFSPVISQYCLNSIGVKLFSTSAVSRCTNKNASAATSMAQELLAAKVKNEKQDPKTSFDPEEDEKTRKQNAENQRRALKFSFISFGTIIIFTAGALIYVWGAPLVDEDGNEIKDEFSHMSTVEQYLKRTYKETLFMSESIQEPSRGKLLPDPLSGMYIQPPYTLVLELKDVMVHPEWTYSSGWRFKKRPGLDYLLQHCGPPLYEVVIYTQEQGMTAYHIVDKLDPNGLIWYKLYKDTTRYVNGKHVKELGLLNRDLKKVIMVDWDKDAVSCPRNQLVVTRWDGSMEDKGLIQLADFLRTIADNEVEDVREVLDYYQQFPDPLAAYDTFRKEAQMKEKIQSEKEKELEKSDIYKTPKTWKPSFIKW